MGLKSKNIKNFLFLYKRYLFNVPCDFVALLSGSTIVPCDFTQEFVEFLPDTSNLKIHKKL